MFFGILTLITGLLLSTIAAWFAIIGIMAVFAGLPIYGMIMGIGIELGKVVGVTWIYRNWTKKTLLKWIMIPFVVVMMGLTSGGIYGLLSKAHLEQTAPVANNTIQIERLDQRILRERTEIADAESIIIQLDQTVQVLVDARKISHPTEGSRIVRINQQPQRDALKNIIDESFDSIDVYEDKKLSLNQELNELELEIGPVKYIAAFIFDDPEENFDRAVRYVIIAFIFVFDPMAILLLMAANYTLMGRIGAPPEPTLTKSARKRRAQNTPHLDKMLAGEPEPIITSVEQLNETPDEPDPQIEETVIHQIEIVESQSKPDLDIIAPEFDITTESFDPTTTVESDLELPHHREIFNLRDDKLTVEEIEDSMEELANLSTLTTEQHRRHQILAEMLEHKRANEHSDSTTRRAREASDNPPIKPEPSMPPSVLE